MARASMCLGLCSAKSLGCGGHMESCSSQAGRYPPAVGARKAGICSAAWQVAWLLWASALYGRLLFMNHYNFVHAHVFCVQGIDDQTCEIY